MLERLDPGPALRDVLAALLPGLIVLSWLQGPLLFRSLAITLAAGFVFDALALLLRRQPQRRAIDGSTLVSALLLGLALPAHAPPWIPVVAAALATVARHAGTGRRRPFNPAMLGLAGVLLAFPLQLATGYFDALSSATPLEQVRSGLGSARTVSEVVTAPEFAHQAGGGLWLAAAWLAGGLFLVRRRRIAWQIPAAVLGGLVLPALLAWALDTGRHASPLFHLWAGGALFTAFFVATDPSTAPATARLRWRHGLAIGAAGWLLRGWGYPDGFAFAILLVNLAMHGRVSWRATIAPAGALLFVLGAGLLLERGSRPASGPEGVLDGIAHDGDPLAEGRDVAVGTLHVARHEGRAVAAIYRVRAEGYGGPIELLVAVKPDGRLSALRVVAQHETEAFALRYLGADRSWLERADTWSGASVTPRAIEAAVRRVLDYHAANRDEIFPPP